MVLRPAVGGVRQRLAVLRLSRSRAAETAATVSSKYRTVATRPNLFAGFSALSNRAARRRRPTAASRAGRRLTAPFYFVGANRRERVWINRNRRRERLEPQRRQLGREPFFRVVEPRVRGREPGAEEGLRVEDERVLRETDAAERREKRRERRARLAV